MSIHALFLDLLCLPLTLYSFLLAGTGEACGAASLPLLIDLTLLPSCGCCLWRTRLKPQVFGLGGEWLACLWSTAAQNKKPLDHPYFNRLRGAGWGDGQSRSVLSVGAGARCDTPSFSSVHCLSSLLCYHFSPLATSHTVFPRFCPSFLDSAAARKPLWLTVPFGGMLA